MIFTNGQRVVRDDGLRATFLRALPGGVYGVFRYDDDNTPERVTQLAAFAPEPNEELKALYRRGLEMRNR